MSVPGGAIPSGSTVTVTVTQSSSGGGVTDPYRVSDVFTINPSGTVFLVPVRVTLPIPSSFSGDVADLVLYTRSTSGANEELDALATTSSTISGETSHFSPFWISEPPAAQSVTVTPSDPTIQSGNTVQLSAEVRDAGGNVLPGAPVTWSSADGTIAEVDENSGLVTGKLAGQADVTATAAQGVSGSVTVTVEPGPASAIVVDPATASLSPGGEVQLTARFVDGNGNTTTGGSVNWVSDAPGVATVTSGGLVQGVTKGTANISALSGDLEGVAVIRVQDPPISLGETVVGNIPTAGVEDTIYISLNITDVIDLAVFPEDGSGILPHLQLTRPSGDLTYVDFGWTTEPQHVAVIPGFTVSRTGIWRIIVRGAESSTGGYVLRTRNSQAVLETLPTEVLVISAQTGGGVVQTELKLGNPGAQGSSWSADDSQLPAGVSLSSTGGTLSASADVDTNPLILTVNVDPNVLGAGTHNHEFTLSLADPWGGPARTIGLRITVSSP